MTIEYWKECIATAIEECGLVMTDGQLEYIADSVQGGHENYGMAFGYDIIRSQSESRAEVELRELKRDIQKRKDWEISTNPCKYCYTTGIVKDGWGRDVGCTNCGGTGRV